MDLIAFRRLLSPEGQTVLDAAMALRPTEANLLACHQRLRKQFPDDLVRAALETAILRNKAASKFSRAERMYFTREALEQSSGEVISSYRAQRFATFARVGDFCTGIGGDAIGLTAMTHIVAIDADELRLAMAEENLRVYDRAGRASFLPGDLRAISLPDLDAAFFDPDRRGGGRRHVRLRDYVPALDDVRSRLPADFPLGVKVAPGASWDDLRGYGAEAEFISVDGELKECVLWFGPLETISRRATVLPRGATLFAEKPAEPREPGPPLAFLHDPDPAVVRAGLVANLAELLDARPIDSSIAYLTSDRLVTNPWTRVYAIDESIPFHARRLGERLRAMNVGIVTMTRRGSAVDLDELRRSWRLTGDEARTVILTRVSGRPWALIARPVA
jgi:hypothetical protein